MDFKEYLNNQKEFSLSAIASRMWPSNKSADTYLSTKLNGGRPFTEKDEQMARRALIDLGAKLIADGKRKFG